MTWQKRVINILKDYDMTQKELAIKLNIREASLSRKLNLQRPFTVNDLIKISKFTKIPIARLLGEYQETLEEMVEDFSWGVWNEIRESTNEDAKNECAKIIERVIKKYRED